MKNALGKKLHITPTQPQEYICKDFNLYTRPVVSRDPTDNAESIGRLLTLGLAEMGARQIVRSTVNTFSESIKHF